MEIKRLGYSAKPWRLLTKDGYEVCVPCTFDHPHLGVTQISEPVAGNTRKECEGNALALLEWLLTGTGNVRITTPFTKLGELSVPSNADVTGLAPAQETTK